MPVSANIFLGPQEREIVIFSFPIKLYSSNSKGLSFILRFSFPILLPLKHPFFYMVRFLFFTFLFNQISSGNLLVFQNAFSKWLFRCVNSCQEIPEC